MKLFLAYHIWQKADMLAWLLDGIARNFDPANTELGFVFDAPADGGDQAFEAMKNFWLDHRGFLFVPNEPGHYETHPFKYVHFKAEPECREVGGHNLLLRHFMEHTDCDLMLAPQDDIRFNRPVWPELANLLDRYGKRLGLIGGRDGWSDRRGYTDLAGSFWSGTNPPPVLRLQHGQAQERVFLNSGPICYPRHVVEKVGYLDEQFYAWYVWEDYGYRAHQAGFTNIIMGMDCFHHAFGRMGKSTLYQDGKTAHDLNYFHAKHGSAPL